jgi:PAS domain S-box-containing protein
MPTELDLRILVYGPTSRDSQLTCEILAARQIVCIVCPNVGSMVHEMERGVGGLILAEEVVLRDDVRPLVNYLQRQPAWSDLPVILITHQGSESLAVSEAVRHLGNVTLLERPTRVNALVTAAQGALRARRRQFQARDLIRAREQAARKLAESEQRFRILVEQVKDYAIFMMDLEGRVTSWNEGVRRMLGFEEAEFLGLDVSRIFTPEDVAAGVPAAELAEAASRGEAGNDRWMQRKDGSRFWASGVTTALRDPGGEPIGYTKVMRDLTARIQD